MKTNLKFQLIRRFEILSVFLFFFCFTTLSAKDIFVATTGNNTTGTGVIGSPYLTIQKAASVAVAGDIIQVRAGTYREQVTPTNSGTAGNPITYQPYNNEEVTISGTEYIAGWVQHSGNIYKATMSGGFMNTDYNQTDQVFVDQQMMSLARWPNNTNLDPSYPTKSLMTTFTSKKLDAISGIYTAIFTDAKIPAPNPANQYDSAEIYVQPNYQGWSWLLSGTVKSVVGTKITMTSNSGAGQDGNQNVYAKNSRYFIYNKLSLLDAAGEWYHDKDNHLLYLWCPDNANPSNKIVEAKRREYAFNLTSKSYITIKGFKLFACSITTDISMGGTNGDIGSTYKKSPYVSASHHCIIDGIDAKFLSHFTNVAGHMLFQWGGSSGIVLSGSDHLIQNCVIQYSAGNGVALIGYRHKVLNNYFSDIDYIGTECSAVNSPSSTISEAFEIGYNTIKRCGRSGIVPRWNYTSTNTLDSRIHHNDISYCMIQDWDGGGIYCAGDQKFLRVDHNTIHECLGFINCGIYFDWAKNFIIDHNVVWNVENAIKIQESDAQKNITNSVCYNNTLACYNLSFPTQLSSFGGSGGKIGSVIQNNICVYRKETSTTAPSAYKTYESGYTTGVTKVTNLEHATTPDPKFVDFVNGNLQLLTGSAAIDAGTLMTSVTLDGVTIPAYNDAVTGTIDIGAYEFGQTAFTTGAPSAVASNITLTPTMVSVAVNASTTIMANATPGNSIITWSSGNTAIATVNSNGTVTGVSVGMVMIIATSGSITKTCVVTVTADPNIQLTSNTETSISVFPNPITNNTFTINIINGATEKATVTIIDALGNSVYANEYKNTPSITISIPELSHGLYFVRVNDGTTNNLTTKMVVE